MKQHITLTWLNLIRSMMHNGKQPKQIIKELLLYGYSEENRINSGFGNDFIEIDDFINSFDTELEYYEPNRNA